MTTAPKPRPSQLVVVVLVGAGQNAQGESEGSLLSKVMGLCRLCRTSATAEIVPTTRWMATKMRTVGCRVLDSVMVWMHTALHESDD